MHICMMKLFLIHQKIRSPHTHTHTIAKTSTDPCPKHRPTVVCANWCRILPSLVRCTWPAVRIGALDVGGGDNGAPAGTSRPPSKWSTGLWRTRVNGPDSIGPQSDCARHYTLIARNPSTEIWRGNWKGRLRNSIISSCMQIAQFLM